jgi:tetratricopeptide (TPR) repeat protein
VHTLAETHMLVGERGAYHLARTLPTIQMPATVQAVLAARIDRLPPEAKHLLQTTAVIGTEAPFPLLQAIAELPEDALHRSLTHLQAAEFLYETRLFPEREFTFKHALTQEVAYRGLLHERRRALHARIVEGLEARRGDGASARVERLADHALRGEAWDKALGYFQQAGERAMTRSAHREAVRYFEQALSALQHLPETHEARVQAIDLRLALRSALRNLNEFERMLAYLREAEALAAALGDAHRLGLISGFLSQHFRMLGSHDQAVAAAQRALALTTAGRDGLLHALANLYLGRAYKEQGDYRRAVDCMRQIVSSLDEARHRERLSHVLLPAVNARANLAACHAELGRFPEGHVLGEEGIRIAEAVAHPASLLCAHWGVGLLALRQGDLPRALPPLERDMGMCQDADLSGWFPRIASLVGSAYALAGRVADAVPLLTQALDQTIAEGTAEHQVFYTLCLGEA